MSWTYGVIDQAVDFLGEEESVTDAFDVVIKDGSMQYAMQTIEITVNGSNDAPTIFDADDYGQITELPDLWPGENQQALHTEGRIEFEDADLTDSHAVRVTGNDTSGYRGILTAYVAVDQADHPFGDVMWSFDVADAGLDDLTPQNILHQHYQVMVDDPYGGTAMQEVVI